MMGLDDVKGVANVVNGNHLIDGQKPCSLVLIKYVLVHVCQATARLRTKRGIFEPPEKKN